MVSTAKKSLLDLTLFAVCLLALATAASPARSQGNRSSDTELLLSDDAVVTTATKTVQKVGDSPSAITVIDEKTIRLSGATTIPELLRLVPGVNVTEINQSEYDVGMRGFNQIESNKLLVMVDGRPIYQDIYGNVDWDEIPLLISQIKRIEVVRGPGSALYGANAFDGVINIITKTPLEMVDPEAPATVRVAAGQQSSLYSEVTATQGKPSDWAVSVGAADNQTAGFMPDKTGYDHDGYRIPIVTLDAEKSMGQGDLRLSAGGLQGKADFLDPVAASQDADSDSYYTSLTYSQTKVRNPITARFYTDSSNEPFWLLSEAQDQRSDFDFQQEVPTNRLHDIVYGVSYRYDRTKFGYTGPGWHNQDIWSLYAQDEYHAGPATNLFTGIRFDDQSQYGSAITPRISLVHHLADDQTLRLSYGTAFRAPTVLESYLGIAVPYGPLTFTLSGNSNLKPEQIQSLEFGYRKDFTRGDVGITAYDNWAHDLIQFVATQFAPSPPFPPDIETGVGLMNIGQAHVRGVEFESEYRLAQGVKAIFNYSYEDARDSNGQLLALAPPYSTANFAIRADLPNRFTGWLSVHSVGSTSEPGETPSYNQSVGSYTQVDARIGYRFGPKDQPMYFSVGATNLFNDGHYEYPQQDGIIGVPTAARIGRTYWVMIDGKL